MKMQKDFVTLVVNTFKIKHLEKMNKGGTAPSTTDQSSIFEYFEGTDSLCTFSGGTGTKTTTITKNNNSPNAVDPILSSVEINKTHISLVNDLC